MNRTNGVVHAGEYVISKSVLTSMPIEIPK